MAVSDAARLGVVEQDWMRITSDGGSIEAPVRLGDINPGTLFVPFQYGYWDDPGMASTNVDRIISARVARKLCRMCHADRASWLIKDLVAVNRRSARGSASILN